MSIGSRLLICVFMFKFVLNKGIHEGRSLDNTEQGFMQSFFSGFCLIFVSELLDRTFFLNMIYGLNHSFIKTFLISSATLLTLNFAALFLGNAMPLFLYKHILDWIAVFVFFLFGSVLIYDSLEKQEHVMYDEYEEVKDTVRKQSMERKASDNSQSLRESLIQDAAAVEQPEESLFETAWPFVTSIILAEIGDKSQITGVVIGAVYNFYGVLLGTSLGLVICIFLSIWSGQFLSKKITTRQIHLISGIIFMIFGVSFLLQILDLV